MTKNGLILFDSFFPNIVMCLKESLEIYGEEKSKGSFLSFWPIRCVYIGAFLSRAVAMLRNRRKDANLIMSYYILGIPFNKTVSLTLVNSNDFVVCKMCCTCVERNSMLVKQHISRRKTAGMPAKKIIYI